jgi:hypothetical protein
MSKEEIREVVRNALQRAGLPGDDVVSRLSMANCNSSLHAVVLTFTEPFAHVRHTCYEPFASDGEPVRELTDSILAKDSDLRYMPTNRGS